MALGARQWPLPVAVSCLLASRSCSRLGGCSRLKIDVAFGNDSVLGTLCIIRGTERLHVEAAVSTNCCLKTPVSSWLGVADMIAATFHPTAQLSKQHIQGVSLLGSGSVDGGGSALQ